MGFGMPAAMGVKVALPDQQVICISGDASFQMNSQELATLAQYGIAVKTVIINNFWQGMVRQWQQAFYEERYSHSNMAKGMPDFVKLAEAYGVKGLRVSDRHDLDAIVQEVLAYDGPCYWMPMSPAMKIATRWWLPARPTRKCWGYQSARCCKRLPN